MAVFDEGLIADPTVFAINTLPPHSDHRCFADSSCREDFTWSLNGTWQFSYAPNTAAADPAFWDPAADRSDWDEIVVPGHLQLQGFGAPQYVNVEYPWDGLEAVRPGQVPTRFNPVGLYVRTFTLPVRMQEGPVHISFQGVESGFSLWLNGSWVGYSEDSFTPAEFDLTPYINRQGKNVLAAAVFRFTAGSWCEDQDFFRFSGIFRDVYLFAPPRVHVWDLKLVPTLGEDLSRGTLEATLQVSAPGRVQACLGSPAGSSCGARQVSWGEGKMQVSFSMEVDSPLLWSAEQPNLYTLELTVADLDGIPCEYIQERVGFRRFEIDHGVLCLNGKRIVFRGVNRHEFSATSGRCISDEDILKDILIMKQNNINAIRTSHYPNRTALYRLCDTYGLYLMDETNLETHGTWDAIEQGLEPRSFAVPGDRPEYLGLILHRAENMYQRDKNHPSILMWSCGNESYGGKNLQIMHDQFHAWDPTRPVHYEGVTWDQRYPDTTDVVSNMYTPAALVADFLKEHREKPFLMCEYAHAMGNSCGALHKYTDLTRTEPLYQGGFIWDYIDQSLTCQDRYGRSFQAYGGDFEDRPNDGSFSGNGIVYGENREPSPKMQEVKYCYQPFGLRFEGNILEVTNDSLFTDAAALTLHISLHREGELLSSWEGKVSAPAVRPWREVCREQTPCQRHRANREQETMWDHMSPTRLPLPISLPRIPGEYVLTAALVLPEDTPWAKKGHEIAWGQGLVRIFADGSILVTDPVKTQQVFSGDTKAQKPQEKRQQAETKQTQGQRVMPSQNADQPLQIIQGWHNTGIFGEDVRALFSGLHGGFISLRREGNGELLAQMPRPNFWRALTENDRANLLGQRGGQWKLASLYATHKTRDGRGATPYGLKAEADGSFLVKYTYHLGTKPAMDCHVTYRVTPEGWITVILAMEASREVGELPAFGLIFPMDLSFSHVKWYGLGPEETYQDRCHAKLGVYENTAAENLAAYLVPQECGSKVGVRWAQVTDDSGYGIRVEAVDTLLTFSALPYSPHELELARHPQELPLPLYTWVCVSMQQMGVGGDDTWGARTHPEYCIDNSVPLTFTFRMRVLPGGNAG